jgi:hypothetical protein
VRSGARDPASALSPREPTCRTGAPTLPAVPGIRVLRIEHGRFPWSRSLNPKFPDGGRLLFAALDIAWSPPDAAFAIGRIEEELVAFRPGFSRHECRGAAAYHVFRVIRPASLGRPGDPPPLEGPLALAHLIEHAVIDFQCLITEARSCSGATAARRAPAGRFDLVIECRDFAVGRCCLALAVDWLTSIARGHRLGPAERIVLAAAGAAYRRRGGRLRPALLARTLGSSEPDAGRALCALAGAGYLIEVPRSKRSRGAPEYRVSAERS